MALLSTQQIQITGPAITLAAAAAGGDTVTPGDRTFLWVKNTDATSKTVTVVVPGEYYAQPLTDVAVTVPATTGERLIGPLDQKLATDGVVSITYSAVTNVTVAAVRI